jgi:ABC-type phosphate/phosphonate transport system substrate-binding protein
MYPFASVAWAWDAVWAAVHDRVPWLPAELNQSGDVHARWYDANCIVTHVCGAPFELDIPEAEPVGHYRSVLLSPHDLQLDELVGPGRHAVANSADSLSGWLSLLAATVGPRQPWPGSVTFTSAHVDSIRALAKGEADLAAIDSWSLGLFASDEPDLVDGLHRAGLGPRIPTPAITARKTLDTAHVAEVRQAFREALADPATADARAALRISGFAENSLDDYRSTLRLVPD